MTTPPPAPSPAHRLPVRALVIVLVVLVVCAAAVLVAERLTSDRTVVAEFAQSVGVFPGDDVRILGVKVGSITAVEPSGDKVRVTMSYDRDQRLAADATAAVVTPTLVSIRYVQLGPQLVEQGPELPDDAVIPRSRTAAPFEWDEIKDQVNELATNLGPQAPGQPGVLARAVGGAARNLDGQGEAVNRSVTSLSEAFATLSEGRGDLFATVRNLQTFSTALSENDAQVRQFNDQLASASGVLADNGAQLDTLLRTIDRTAPVIERFVADNRGRLDADVRALSDVTTNLAQNRQALADVLQRAPIALSNLHNIYDPFTGSVTSSLADTNLNDPAQFLCSTGAGVVPGGAASPEAATFCQTALRPLLDAARQSNFIPVGTNPITRSGAGGAAPGADPAPSLPNLLLPGGGGR